MPARVYEELVKTYRELAARSPETYLPDMAFSLNRLGTFHRESHRDRDARKAYEDEVKTYRDLAARDPASLSALPRFLPSPSRNFP